MLLYSETLYYLYLNLGFATQVVYLLLFVYALVNIKSFNGGFRRIFWLIAICAFFENTGYITQWYGLENDFFRNHLYLFFSTVFEALVFYYFIDNKRVKWIVLGLIPLLLIGIVVTGLYNENYLRSPILSPVKFGIFFLFSIILHRQLIKNTRTGELRNTPLFWFNIALMFTSGYMVLFGIFWGYMVEISDDGAFLMGIIGNIFDYVHLVLWFIMVYKLGKQKLH
ncbi:hypothetical protein [Jiulongibacter sp. NS-SX5]|uniref:hypothetical protein n=1 Tax=Jiulongibacter sp. NS-SX5 TaxID=3463854 RepID=UPI004058AF3A